jgi:hypothetical protein
MCAPAVSCFKSNHGEKIVRIRISLIVGTVLAVSSLSLQSQAQSAKMRSPLSPPSNPVKSGKGPIGLPEPTAISPESLATVTEILHKCGQVDPANGTFYSEFLAVVISGHSSFEITSDEGSMEYQSEAKLIDRQLASTPAGSLAKSCRTIVP